MFVGTALFVRLLIYVGLSLFIISGPYLYMVVCVLYAYNLTVWHKHVTKRKSVLNCENNMVDFLMRIDRLSERETSAHSEGIDRQIKKSETCKRVNCSRRNARNGAF